MNRVQHTCHCPRLAQMHREGPVYYQTVRGMRIGGNGNGEWQWGQDRAHVLRCTAVLYLWMPHVDGASDCRPNRSQCWCWCWMGEPVLAHTHSVLLAAYGFVRRLRGRHLVDARGLRAVLHLEAFDQRALQATLLPVLLVLRLLVSCQC